MKFYRRIWIKQQDVPPEVYSAVVRLKSERQRGDFFFIEAQPEDEVANDLVDKVLTLCQESGLSYKSGADPGSYEYLSLPVYEQCDLETASLLRLWTQKRMFKGIDSDKRDERGRIVLPATGAKTTINIASIWPKPWIVVSDAVRQTLESGGLAGLKFDEAAIKGHSIHTSPAPFWELQSAFELPKMVNSVPDTAVEWEQPRHLIRDSYGEPHYRQCELQPLGSFDIAHTFERLSGGEPALIISQRFYQHCLKNKIPLEVRPARIDS